MVYFQRHSEVPHAGAVTSWQPVWMALGHLQEQRAGNAPFLTIL